MDNSRRFYVYVHRRKTDGVIFYVGKGSARRLSDTKNRNPHWRKVVNKHGFTTEKVFDGLAEQCAYSIERILIATLPNLANYATGGEVNSGYKWSDEARSKIAIQRAGVKRKPLSEAHKAKISLAHKGRTMKPEWIEKMAASKRGKAQAPEHAEKSRTAKIGKKQPLSAVEHTRMRMRKSVRCLNDGIDYPSMGHAAAHYGVSLAGISMNCSGKMKAIKGLNFQILAYNRPPDDEGLPEAVEAGIEKLRRYG